MNSEEECAAAAVIIYDTHLQELRFDEINDLQHLFRIHESTFSKFIPEVCESIYNNLKDKYLKVKLASESWLISTIKKISTVEHTLFLYH